jgi:hypothetical protein
VEQVLKTAAENKCAISVKHTNSEGDVFEIHMTAPQAEKILEDVKTHHVSIAPSRPEPKYTTGAVVPSIITHLPEVNKAIDRLYDQRSAELSQTEAEAIADALFHVLEDAGLTSVIPILVEALYARGSYVLAGALQNRNKPSGTLEPPITTR